MSSNILQLYPSLEDMMIGKVINSNESIEDIKHTFLQPTLTPNGKKTITNHKNLYSDLSNELALITNSKADTINKSEATEATETKETKETKEIEIIKTNEKQIDNIKTSQMTIAQKISSCMTHIDGVRDVILIKQKGYSLGVAFVEINTSYYVAFVEKNSIASQAKLRFGDQVVRINSLEMAGVNNKTIMKYIESLPDNELIHFIIRDRPWQKVYKLMKDTDNYIGINFKNGNIVALVKDSSSSRNGIPTDHQIIEINSQTVIGLSDKEISTIFAQSGRDIYISLMPVNIYKKLISGIPSKKLTKEMDHSFMYC